MNDADRLKLPDVGPEGLEEHWDEIGHTFDFAGETHHVYDHYDRAGNPISMRDWARLRAHAGREYAVVQQDEIGPYWVSTVWVGLDMGFGRSEPLIFETMVFRGRESDLDCWRYSTEKEAWEGHPRMLEQVRVIDAATT